MHVAKQSLTFEYQLRMSMPPPELLPLSSKANACFELDTVSTVGVQWSDACIQSGVGSVAPEALSVK